LCATKFQFAPKYADGAPEKLPLYEVFLGLTSRTFAKWMPLALRLIVAMSLWLVVVPLATSYSYHGWMNRPSSIPTRWKRELLLGDAISGAVVAGFIIISFLSLMSFADFLRFQWQQHGPGGQPPRERLDEDGRAEADPVPPSEEEVDDVILDMRRQRDNVHIHQVGVMDQRQPLFANNHRRQSPNRRVQWMDLAVADDLGQDIHRALGAMPDDPVAQRRELQRRIQAAATLRRRVEQLNDQLERANDAQHTAVQQLDRINDGEFAPRPRIDGDGDRYEPNETLDETQIARFLRAQHENDGDNNNNFEENEQNRLLVDFRDRHREEPGNNVDEGRLARFLRAQEEDDDDDEDGGDRQDEPIFPDNDRFEPQFEPLDPVMNQEEPPDVEMNMALDELLGLRGPFGALLRNLLWLLAFNVTYLGIFAFIPRSFGSLVYSLFLNTTGVHILMNYVPYFNLTNTVDDEIGFVQILSVLEGESQRLSTTLQLSDLATIGLGYFSTAWIIVIVQYALQLHKRLRPVHQEDNQNPAPVDDNVAPEPIIRMQVGGGLEDPFDDPVNPAGEQFPDLPGTIGEMLAMALESTAAVVKVGVLLFLKMLFLPLVLGIWLDAATLPLFGSSASERMLHAGRDLFSSALLHWVVGISFMLLVTVSVLQLREVMHPGLLAKVIRPQEPQPDLLGNLLNENGFVHAKRMTLSFGIYSMLLAIHIWIPAKVVAASGVSSYLPFLKPRLNYFLPAQLQIPLELLLFHLTMLGLLEKYKNNIGETQHYWLAFMCDKLSVSDYLLPRSIERFVLAGYRPIFVNADDNSDALDLIPEDDMATTTTVSFAEGASLIHLEHKLEKVTNPASLRQIRDLVHVDPFWYKMAQKPADVVNLIETNMVATTSFEEPTFEMARTRRDGQRILVGSKGFIRLPLPSGEQDVVDRRRRRAGADAEPATAESKNLFSTKQGPYRLKRSVRGNGILVIEFWKEVPGRLIPRPPEGWDDLGAGGAEVQGRWSWGREKPSAIEKGVAYQKPFFGHGSNFASAFPLLVKLVFLINIAWVCISLLICMGLSTPLWVGRSVLHLLQLPQKYHHDPFALAIGLAIICPTLVILARFMKREEAIFARAQRWITSFSLPPSRKAVTMITSAGVWFILAPLLVGSLYDLLFFKSQTWFIGENSFSILDASLIVNFASGSLLLNGWAAMTYANAFTRQFWYNLANAAFEDDDVGQGNGRAHRAPGVDALGPGAGDGEYLDHWQGQNGRVGRFIGVIKAVLLKWEWDRVDPDILVYHFLLPIVQTLCISLISPATFYASWHLASMADRRETLGVIVPYFGRIEEGVYRLLVFRIYMILTFGCQFMLGLQSQLKDWFQLAHKAARDDRYLVGEVLLNYAEK
jgi:hypothetical protein